MSLAPRDSFTRAVWKVAKTWINCRYLALHTLILGQIESRLFCVRHTANAKLLQ